MSHKCCCVTNVVAALKDVKVSTYRQAFKLLVVSVNPAKDLLAVPLQLLQLFLNDSCIQRFALFNQTFTLSQGQLNLCCVQNDLLLESLRRKKQTALEHWKFEKTT